MAAPGFMTVRFVRPWYSPDNVLYGRKERVQQVPEAFEEFLPSTAVILDGGGSGKHMKRVEAIREEKGQRPLNMDALAKLADADTMPRDHAMLDEDGDVVVQKPKPNPPAEPGNFTKQPTSVETAEGSDKPPTPSTDKDAKAASDSKAASASRK